MDERDLTALRRKVLITGASGFTGRHACRVFAEAGWSVAAVLSPSADEKGLAGSAAASAESAQRCDMTEAAAVHALVRRARPDAVLHLAGRNAVDASWRDPAATLAANLMSTVHLLEAVRGQCPDARMLVVGSMLKSAPEDLHRSGHPYAFSKTLQVAAAAAWHGWYGLPVLTAEPCNLIGPGGNGGLCGKIARWAVQAEWAHAGTAGASVEVPAFALSSLRESRDFLDVRDAAAAYEMLLASGKAGQSYDIASGVFRTLEQVQAAFNAAADAPLRWQIGHSAASSPLPKDTEAIRALGWRPAIPFERSIREMLEEERFLAASRRLTS